MVFIKIFVSIVIIFIIYISFYRLREYRDKLKIKNEYYPYVHKVINIAFVIASITASIAIAFVLSFINALSLDESIERILAIGIVVGWGTIAFLIVLSEIIKKCIYRKSKE